MKKAICFVAHPDDCIIFALPYISANSYEWTIVYLTYTDTDDRAIEVRNFWNKKNIKTTFLGFEDLKKYTDPNNIDFKTAQIAFYSLITDVELILTHSSYGEYEHPHHILCHDIVKSCKHKKVYFADNRQYNVSYYAEDINLDDIPLHKHAVKIHRQVVAKYLDIN